MVFGVGITLALFVGMVISLLLPLPALMFRLKLGRAKGAAVTAIVFSAMAIIIGGGVLELFSLLALLVLGFVLGESFEKEFPLEKTMIVVCGTQVTIGFMALLFHSNSVGIGIWEMLSGYADAHIAYYKATIDQMGVAIENRQALHAYIDWFGPAILRPGFPGIAISSILFTAWINLLFAKIVFSRVGLTFPDFGSLNQWRAPEMLIWPLIGCGLLLLLPAGGLKIMGLNGLLVMLLIYFFQGIAIVSFYFEKMRLPLLARWVLYFFTLQVLPLVIGLGVFDMWLNVRKIKSNPGD
jgi:uncharacterized protein YybS (DUF2232 family)